jgi:cell wall-associated NlpC family hydrolase
MTEADQRAAVVAEALSWLRTPYHHQAAVKGVGADCAMFPQAVYVARGIMPHRESIGDYPVQWHMHHDEERYLAAVLKYSREIDGPPLPGDFMLFKFGKAFAHGAIVIEWPCIIHARLGGCVELADAEQDGIFRHKNGTHRERRFFTPWGASP